MRIKFKLIIYLLTLVLICSCTNDKQSKTADSLSQTTKTINLLTIGNSFADNALYYLDEITESVPGYEINITKANIGGASLKKHAGLIAACKNDSTLKPYRKGTATLEDILKTDNYDIITIQQVSSSSFKPETFHPHADILIEFIKEHAPSAEIMIHQTWAYSPTCERLEKWGLSREEMHNGLLECYNTLAEQNNFTLLKSGSAFFNSFKERPDIELWSEGEYHANFNGYYLAGCVWFATIFEVSPEKVTFVPEELDVRTAAFLRKIAAQEAVY